MLRVFIALGKQLPKNKAMVEDTEGVARLLAKYNCTMVQGGAKIGLMGVVASEFQKYSDEVVMIVPEVHKADLVGTTSKEHYIVEGESDRMRITIHTCDMMVVLPGGSGTLAELSYYNETCKSGEHNAKIVVVNTDGFYNKLFKFHKHQIKNGLMGDDGIKYQVIKSVKDLEPIIQQLIADKQARLQQEEVNKNKEALVDEIIKDASKPMVIKKLPASKTVKTALKSKAKAKTQVKEEKAPVIEKNTKTNTNKKATANKKEVSTKSKKTASKAKPAVKVEPKKDAAKPADKVVKTSAVAKKVTTKKAEPKQAKAKAVKKVETEKKEAVVVEKPKAKKALAKSTPAKKATKTSATKTAKTAPAKVKPVKKATTKKTETKPVAKKASASNKLEKAKKPVAKKTSKK